jgi:hypothetical protein
MSLAYAALFTHLSGNRNLQYHNFSIPYVTDAGVATTLPAVLVSRAGRIDPLVVATCGGMDFALPGEMLRSLYAYLDDGLAVLYYEGPGQGRTLTANPPLQFTPSWDRVLTAVDSYIAGYLGSYYASNQGITAVSESFGGFLLMQACSNYRGTQIQGCVADPATASMAYAVNYLMAGWILAPFAGVNPTTLASQCGPNCYSYASNYFHLNATWASPQAIFSADPLFSELLDPSCTSGVQTMAGLLQGVVFSGMGGIVPPLFNYMVMAVLGPGNNTYSDLSALQHLLDTNPPAFFRLLALAFGRMQQFYVSQAQLSSSQVAFLTLSTEQDFALQSAQSAQVFASLPQNNLNAHHYFTADTGAAVHCEAGAWEVLWPH